MAKRAQIRLPDDVYEKLVMWADKLGMSAAQLGGMALQAGLDSIIRAVAPAESMTPKQWALILQAMQEQGISLDGVRVGSEELPGGEDETSNRNASSK